MVSYTPMCISIWICVVCIVFVYINSLFVLLFCSFQVALNVGEAMYALIFGWNTFVALVLQSIMTLLVTDERGLDLSSRNQVSSRCFRSCLL